MGLKNGIIAAVAASATLASGLGFVASADAATPVPAGGAGSARVGADPANCDHVGALGSSGVNGTSRWSLGRDGTLTIGAGTLASGCTYVDGLGRGNADVKRIDIAGPVTAGADSDELFVYMEDVTGFDGLENLDTSHVTDMDSMFMGDYALTALDVSHFDTSHVTDMSSMFMDAHALTALDVSHFDTSHVTYMDTMFDGDHALGSLDVSHFDTSHVTNMGGMFSGDHALGSLDVSHFDTSHVTDMSAMFQTDHALTALDVSHFDTSHVTYMRGMFSNSGLREVRLGAGFRFIGGNGAAGFPEAGSDGSGRYTGKWVNVGSGTENDPRGANVWDAEQLMASYDGSRDADTYVWQPKAPVVSPGVTVKYVDEQGNRVHADQSITGNVGASYDASTSVYRLDVRGYALDGSKLPANAKGALSDRMQTVVYTYRKAPAPAPAPDNNGGNGSLATTGASVALASLGGVLLLAMGLSLLWRRRRA